MAILGRYAPTVPQGLSPNVGRSTADFGEHAADVRIRGRQSSRSIHLDENPQFYEGFRALVLAWVSWGAASILRSLPIDGVTDRSGIGI
jgi:hypothetical protein